MHGPRLFNRQPLHEPAVLLWCEFPDFIRCPWPLQPSFFQAFVEEQETITLPEQGLEPVPATAAKQEKRKLERQAKRCGLSLSGYLRRVGTGEPVAAFHSQRFHELYRQVNGLRDDPTTQPMERTAAQLDELAGLILTAYTSGGVDDGDH